MDEVFEKYKQLDRDALMEKMAHELPKLRKKLGAEIPAIADKTGIEEDKLTAIEEGKKHFKWSEFMAVLFVFWNDDIGRGLVEKKGLFPDELKAVMYVNRNVHAPVTESAKYGI